MRTLSAPADAYHLRALVERMVQEGRTEDEIVAAVEEADDRPPSQRGIVPLLDRREERVDVGVQDRRSHTNLCSHTSGALSRDGHEKSPVARAFSVAGL